MITPRTLDRKIVLWLYQNLTEVPADQVRAHFFLPSTSRICPGLPTAAPALLTCARAVYLYELLAEENTVSNGVSPAKNLAHCMVHS